MSEPSAVARALGAVSGKATVSSDDADRVAYSRDLWPRHLVDLREGRARTEKR